MKKLFTLFIAAMACICAIAQNVDPARGAAQATLEPQELYMTATVGDTVTAYLTLTNTGTVTISPLWALTSSPGYIWTEGYNGDIPPAPGDNVRLIPVTYIPEAAGTHTAHLSMYLDGDFYYVDITGVAVESTEPQVTATPVITVEEHITDYDPNVYPYTDDGSYVTFTATGNGDVRLYVNGYSVENPYRAYCWYEPQYCYITATAQEEGKLISETATLDYIVPAWNHIEPLQPSPLPVFMVEELDDYVIVTVEASGTLSLYLDGVEVQSPYYIPRTEVDQNYEFIAINTEEGMAPTEASFVVTVAAIVSEEQSSGIIYTITSDGEVSVSGVLDDVDVVNIPETVEISGVQYTVTGIMDYAFYCNGNITSINIPSTVVTIGGAAFNGTENLTSITIAQGNPVFDSRSGCNAIIETATNTLLVGCKGTVIPGTVTTIGEESFYHQKSLTAIEIPNSVTAIKECAFDGTGLTTVTLPNSVTEIGDYAFAYCNSLTSIDLGQGVRTIGIWAFRECSKLAGITIPASVTSIGSSVFSGCYSMNEMSVDEGNTVYDSRNGCNAIIQTATRTLVFGCMATQIPSTVTAIGERAFQSCTGLTAIVIPSPVKEIGNYAFDGCKNLQSVVIPNSVTTIGSCAFQYCDKLANLVLGNKIETINSSAFAQCNALTEVVLPNSVKTIGIHAFYHCKGLQRVVISSSVTSIGTQAFYWCESLESIEVASDNSVYDSRNNCNAVIRTSTNTLIQGCRTTVIPEDVLFIGENSFCYAKLASIKIPNSVKSIASSAFEYCYDLAEVEIGSGVAWIGSQAFRRCDALRQVTCHAVTPPTIEKDNTFDCFENYETAVLRVPQTSLDSYKADAEWAKFVHITPFIGAGPGDLNGDGALDVDDVISIISMLVEGGQAPAYADLNGDGVTDIDDVSVIISMMLNGH